MLALAFASCAKLGGDKQEKKPDLPFGPSGVPPQLRGRGADNGKPVTPGGNVIPANLLTAQEDIIYTDPDNPEAGIPELENVLSGAKRGPWEESETIARQRSAREGKPLLIWFTDSQGSPMCKALTDELFATPDFGAWAMENLVRLRVDDFLQKEPDLTMDESETRRTDIRNYNLALKKRYKVLGYPSLIVVSPGGEVMGRYRGYKRGDAQLLWGQLKHATAVSQEAYKGWRSGLEEKGYRDWQGRRDQKIFAKLASYSKGNLVLIEPDGTRSRTKESNLSDTDRAWIAEQKKRRNIQ